MVFWPELPKMLSVLFDQWWHPRCSSVASFISTGYMVVKFKVFVLIQHHEMTPSESFLGLHSPKYCSNLLKCWPEVVPNKINTVFQKPFKILNFGSNGTHTKFTVFVYFGAQFTARKLKILLNTWISAKTTYILRNIKQFEFQVPEKSYYPCKIKQKKYCLCPNLV